MLTGTMAGNALSLLLDSGSFYLFPSQCSSCVKCIVSSEHYVNASQQKKTSSVEMPCYSKSEICVFFFLGYVVQKFEIRSPDLMNGLYFDSRKLCFNGETDLYPT